MDPKELRQKRAGLIAQARAILDKAGAEKRDLTAEEQKQWDALDNDAEKIKGQYERLERQEKAELELRASQGTIAGGRTQPTDDPNGATTQPGQQEITKEQTREAFRSWLVRGMAGLTPEHRAIMANRQSALPAEARAQSVAIDTAGGYLVQDDMVKSIETAQAEFSGVRKTRATVMPTPSGNDIHMPTSNDTSNSGELLGENVAAGSQDITVGSKTLRAYMFSSKLVRVSLQFLQDVSVTGIEGWLAARLGERIGRATGAYYITGTGNNQPEGLAQSTTLGVTAAASAAVTYDELVDLEHSVDIAYRRQSEFLVSDGLLKAIKKLKDGEGRPLWVPGVAVKEPDTILGYRYAVDTNMPTPASAAKTIYFGDFSKFILRDVSTQQILRLTERYAEYLQVGFLLFSRHDSMLLDAGTHPIKHLVHT